MPLLQIVADVAGRQRSQGGCLFGHGTIVSVVRALPDAPSLLLLVLTVIAVERGRPRHAAALVGLAGLAKDSNLLWSTVLLGPARAGAGGGDRCRQALLVLGPLASWMAYLWMMNHASAGLGGYGNFAAPLTEYVAAWGATLSELEQRGSRLVWFKLFALISLATQALVLIAVRARDDPWWRAGIASCVLMVFLGPAVWGGHPTAATRVLLPMTVAFNAVLPRNRWFWPLFVLGNLTVVHGLHELAVLDWIAWDSPFP